jgi:glycosyltransferase involved in cell wall biosynthesis
MPPAAMRPAVLLAANYDGRVGYAWHNIYRLYGALGRDMVAHGRRVVTSFPTAETRAPYLDDVPHETLVFDPKRPTVASVRQAAADVRRLGIREVYLTDQPPTRWDYAWLRAAGVRRIVIHCRISVPDPRPARPETGLRRALKTAWARTPGVSADRVYAVSDFVRDRLIGKACFPAERVRTILNGIDVDRWECPVGDGAGGGVTTFFAAARAARYKGILTLIEAAARVRSDHGLEAFRVRYAGDGPDIGAFRETVARLGLESHVAFLGRQEDTRPEVCAADVIVVPSMNGDACPSTVSEALASGRPLITTRAGGIPELVGGEENARLIEPGDVAALAAAMAELIGDPARRHAIGERGRARARGALRERDYHDTVLAAIREDFALRD